MKKQRGGLFGKASCLPFVLMLVYLCGRIYNVVAVSLTNTPEVLVDTEHINPTDNLRADPDPNFPGLRVLLSNAGIQSASASIQKLVATSFVDTTLPDVSGSEGSGLPGVDVDYHLTNIKVHNFAFEGSTSITLNAAQDSIQASISKIYCDLDMDWHYKTHPIPFTGSGSANDDLYFNIGATLQLNNNGLGDPTLKLISLNVDITSLDIHLHGGASWFYGIFVHAFHSKIESAFRNAISSNIDKAVAALTEKFLTNMPVKVPISEGIGIDYSFEDISENPYMRLYGGISQHVGQFYLTKKPLQCAGKPPYMLPQPAVLSDIQVMLSAHTGSTLGCALHSAGLLNFNLNSTTAPKDFPIQFNTSVFEFVMPQIYTAYPNDAFEVGIVGTAPPTVTVEPNTGIKVNISGNISIIVEPKGQPHVSVLTVYSDLLLLAQVAFDKGNLTGKVINATIEVKVVDTKVGPVSSSVLQFFSQIAIAAGVPYINQVAAVGFPIPYLSSSNIKLSNVNIVYKLVCYCI